MSKRTYASTLVRTSSANNAGYDLALALPHVEMYIMAEVDIEDDHAALAAFAEMQAQADLSPARVP